MRTVTISPYCYQIRIPQVLSSRPANPMKAAALLQSYTPASMTRTSLSMTSNARSSGFRTERAALASASHMRFLIYKAPRRLSLSSSSSGRIRSCPTRHCPSSSFWMMNSIPLVLTVPSLPCTVSSDLNMILSAV